MTPHKKYLFASQVAASLLLFALGCGRSGKQEEYAAPVISNPVLQNNSQCPNGTLLSYENFGEGFMLNYCTTCHAKDLTDAARNGAPTLVNLDRPADMALWRAKMITIVAAKETATMPPSGHIRDIDRQKLAEWLACGAPAETDSILGASD